MILEPITEQSLILLSRGGAGEVALLPEALRPLAHGIGHKVAIEDLPFVQSCHSCRLHAKSAHSDVGVAPMKGPGEFEWILEPESWLQIDGLLEPLCDEEAGEAFQSLNPAGGPRVIYSVNGEW